MDDILSAIIGIALAAILMFIFPLITMADRTDDVSQLTVETATTEFVDTVRSTGKITKAKYDKFVESITSTGNTYNVEMEVQVKDENLAKKVSQVSADKIGENVYYSVYTSQIEDALNKDKAYYCKEGDIVSVSIKNTNQTMSQQLKNFFYTVTGNDSYTIAAEHAGVVTANGN